MASKRVRYSSKIRFMCVSTRKNSDTPRRNCYLSGTTRLPDPHGQYASAEAPQQPHLRHFGTVASNGVAAAYASSCVSCSTMRAGRGKHVTGFLTCSHACVNRLAARCPFEPSNRRGLSVRSRRPPKVIPSSSVCRPQPGSCVSAIYASCSSMVATSGQTDNLDVAGHLIVERA